jgi:5-methylthioadenosine/S-adenosylhomocysteine deaminase
MILVDLGRVHAVPLFDPQTHLVYSCARSDVRHVYVGGRQVVRDGVLVRHDLGTTLDAVRSLIPRIAASLTQ